MPSAKIKTQARIKKKGRIRKKIHGTGERPRLSVFRSAKHVYAQIIDDVQGHTIVSASSLENSAKTLAQSGTPVNKTAMATYIGKILAEKAIEKGIRKVVFDRNGFLYHGRIKAVSQGAREGGLDF
ncbi:MAG: 50S ribosomal protein L18 [Proteobacteria bacterium]|nr:50S ribosomal protein L18 [Desulfobacteraceae bacterium]MBU4319132.1 50S ribosomal protein L18 [Pseudomonadota bacterium]MBU4469255.1 50S ribosomal protein L18 [Pseudomonadota bacterium]MCG2752285.1 50S ribosomal protein L18 [Desulfobacteraceae bacterium]